MNASGPSRAHRLLISAAAAALIGTAPLGCQQEILSTAPQARQQGMKEFEQGNYADAAGSFRNALRSDPRDYKSQYYLGQSYENLKQYQQAIQAYKASIDAQYRTLAGQEDQSQRLRTADALASVIAKSDENDAETNALEQRARSGNQAQDYLLLAKVYQNRGDADSAIDAYNRAHIIEPWDFTIAKEYGLYLAQVGQTPRAQQTLKRAYNLNPNDERVNDALRKLGVVPGPGLKDESALVKPPIPHGPLPEVDLSKFRIGGGGGGGGGGGTSGDGATAPEAAATPARTPAASASPAPQPFNVPPPPTPPHPPAPPPPTAAIPAAPPRALSGPRD